MSLDCVRAVDLDNEHSYILALKMNDNTFKNALKVWKKNVLFKRFDIESNDHLFDPKNFQKLSVICMDEFSGLFLNSGF